MSSQFLACKVSSRAGSAESWPEVQPNARSDNDAIKLLALAHDSSSHVFWPVFYVSISYKSVLIGRLTWTVGRIQTCIQNAVIDVL